MVFLALSVACGSAPSSEPAAIEVVADAEVQDVESPEVVEPDAGEPDSGEAAGRAPIPLTLNLPPDFVGFVEIRAWRKDADGALNWMGAPMVQEAVTGAHMTVTLPPAAPASDRYDDDAVVYAVALRAEDADGEPGVYTGLADAELLWYRYAATDGASLGWNVGIPRGEDMEWLAFADGLTFGENLLAGDELVLEGGTLVETSGTTHLQLADGEDADAASAFDTPLGPGFSIGLSAPPPADVMSTALGVRGALLYPLVYDDEGGDNVRTEEAIRGIGCLGDSRAVVSWVPDAFDLGSAITVRSHGLRTGWDLLHVGPGGLTVEPYDNRTTVELAEACGSRG